MSNHLHLVISAKNHDLSDILRDFKKFTSKQIIPAIENDQHESRRDWMLRIFREEGMKNSRNKNYQFWRQDNQPQELYSAAFVFQKINYIHNNPVEAGIVEKPEHFLHSSAKDYFLTTKCGLATTRETVAGNQIDKIPNANKIVKETVDSYIGRGEGQLEVGIQIIKVGRWRNLILLI